MYKLLIIVTFCLLVFGCESSNVREEIQYFERMEELEPPIRFNVQNDMFRDPVYFWATHRLVLNNLETLYYMPKSGKHNGDIFVNHSERYMISSQSGFSNDWRLVNRSELIEIFNLIED